MKVYDDITIKPGHVGVVTELTGDDILAAGGAMAPETGSGFLVKPGAKGVSPRILKEGTHRLNPFVYAVSIVNIQSQRFELSGADAISFLTLDGFTVNAEGTLEFNLEVDKVALLSHEVGDMDDILQKIVLPAAIPATDRASRMDRSAFSLVFSGSRNAAYSSSAESKSPAASTDFSFRLTALSDMTAMAIYSTSSRNSQPEMSQITCCFCPQGISAA